MAGTPEFNTGVFASAALLFHRLQIKHLQSHAEAAKRTFSQSVEVLILPLAVRSPKKCW